MLTPYLHSGGNLAAVLALKSGETSFEPPLPTPMSLQLLIVPCLDLTASDAPGGRWESNKYAPMLSPGRMNWFKTMYFRSENEWSEWEASPLLAPDELLRKAPRAWIGAGEMDILCNEAQAYAERLNSCGVEAECIVYKGGTHINFGLDSACSIRSCTQEMFTDLAVTKIHFKIKRVSLEIIQG